MNHPCAAQVFNLVSLNLVEPRRRTVTWCQSRGIEVLALLDTTLNKLRAGVEKETFKTLQAVPKPTTGLGGPDQT